MRCRVGFSSRKAIMIATSVISGVVPLMIPASALVTYCWPKLKSIHGTEAQSIYLDPDVEYVTTGVGTEFVMELKVDDQITSLKTFLFYVEFDATKLDTASVVEGPLLPSSGETTVFNKYIVGGTSLQLEGLILGAGVDVAGPGVLATLTFRAIDTGVVTIVKSEC